MENYHKSEVIIVGGGIAGITTAIELLNFGKNVLIIDRDKKEKFGGLAKESFGGMFFVDTAHQKRSGIKDTPEQALKDWYSVANFKDLDIWPKQWAKTYVYHSTSKVYTWLKEKGIRFLPVVHWVERGLFKPGNSVPRFHIVWGTGLELTNTLVKTLFEHPNALTHLTIKYNHKVDELLTNSDRVSGVRGVDESSNIGFSAMSDYVVVATGGMAGNLEKVKKHWQKSWDTPPEVILNGAHKFALGDLHSAVEKNKGVLTHLDKHWFYAAGVHHPRPKVKDHGLSLVPPKSALWLDYTGKRFSPIPLITGYDTKYLVEQICKQEKKYSWQVLNMKIAYKELAISGSEFNKAIREKDKFRFIKTILFGNKALVHDMIDNCIDFLEAESIEELVNKMNELTGSNSIILSNVTESIEEYDTQIKHGLSFHNDDQLRRIAQTRQYRGDKFRTSKFQKIVDKKAGNLIAIREHILSRKTLGGIQTDLDCNVINIDEKPIKGLYAVGESAGFGGGGMHGEGALEGTFLGGCILTGRIAAYAIAGDRLIK